MFILYFLSDIAFVIVYYLLKYRREVVIGNLMRSFPERSKGEIKVIEKSFYKHFCDIWFESVKTLIISKEEVKKRYFIKNPELLQKYYDEGRSVILYSAHQGNWEWLSLLMIYMPYQLTSLYQPISNRYFGKIMKIQRERFGMICVESNNGYRSIVAFSKKNILTLNIIAGDQSPQGDSAKHWVEFLNQKTAFLIGADRIAKKCNQVVIFPSISKISRGHYELELKVIEEMPGNCNNGEIIDRYVELLEETIMKSPALWLWSHKRWKLNGNL